MSEKSTPNPRFGRRSFLAGAACGAAGGGIATSVLGRWARSVPAVFVPFGALESSHGMPGKYPGKVIQVTHPGSVLEADKNGYAERVEATVKQMVGRGMQELVGSDDAVEAWRSFFQRGDRVGIKVVPN